MAKWIHAYFSKCNRFIPKVIKDFAITLLLFFICYRLLFIFESNFNAAGVAVVAFGLLDDLFTLASVITCALLLYNLLKFINYKISYILLEVILFFTFIIFCVFYLAHLTLLKNLLIGLNFTIVMSYLTMGKMLLDYIVFASIYDRLLLALACISYLIVKMIPIKYKKRLQLFIILPVMIFMLMLSSLILKDITIIGKSKYAYYLYASPVKQVFISFLNNYNRFNQTIYPLPTSQINSIKLVDHDFFQQQTNPYLSVKNHDEKLNVVIFVLESVSSKYIFNQVNLQTPMPFLKKLSTKGLWFQNHYTGGNISVLGQFSIFTGLYPNPTPKHFEFQTNLAIPTIANWLTRNYHSFLVSASNNLYFSTGLNNTFNKIYNAYNIKTAGKKLYFHMFLDEETSYNFFHQKLEETQTPFLAVYWSTATHYPYHDYSQLAQITNNINNPFSRYINNLRLLDLEIKKTYELLEKKHLLDKTIFIVIADHGEIFGEHENCIIHGTSLYQEEVKVPLLIYSPKIIKPQQVTHLTSSIDLLPTLLDILHVPYHEKIQGDSLLNANNKRKYIFIYGEQDEIAAINEQQQKMMINFSNSTCVTYNLKNDPEELNPKECIDQKQQEAILKFRNYQPFILSQYNKNNSLNKMQLN